MPRIIASIAVAAALIAGAFIIKERGQNGAASPTALIAEQIQKTNRPALQTYAEKLAASGVASGTTIVVPQPTSDVTYTTTNAPALPPTATDKLAQNILETYVNAKGSGVNISSDIATQIADNVISQTYSGSQAAKTYSSANIKTQTNASASDIKNYGNSVGKIITTTLPQGQESELQIFSDFAASNNDSVLKELDVNIVRYKTMLASLVAVRVPTAFVAVHISLLNSISQILFETQTMQNFPSDPVGAGNAAQTYMSTVQSLDSVITAYKGLFNKVGVTFSPTDTGYIFKK